MGLYIQLIAMEDFGNGVAEMIYYCDAGGKLPCANEICRLEHCIDVYI